MAKRHIEGDAAEPNAKRVHNLDGLDLTDDNASRSPYSTLREHGIRVLVLHPGKFNDPLRGDLKYVRLPLDIPEIQREGLGRRKAYEALSYTWGSPEKPHVIQIVGRGNVPITESLFTALQHLRKPHESRRLWADALCINQSDIAERNAQVAMMKDIYEFSRATLIWLGTGDEDDPLTFAMLKAFLVIGVREIEDPSIDQIQEALYWTRYWKDHSHLRNLPGNHVRNGFAAVLKLMRRPYFTRLWPVQETISSRCELYSGFFTCMDLGLRRAFEQFNRHRLDLGFPRALLSSKDGDLQSLGNFLIGNYNEAVDVIERFLLNSFRICSDPCDRIYALRSILELQFDPDFRPDYSLGPAVLYERFARRLITEDDSEYLYQSLMLALVGTEREVQCQLDTPSWVADINNLTAASRAKQNLYDLRRMAQMYAGVDIWNHIYETWAPTFDGTHPGQMQLRGNRFAVVASRLDVSNVPILASDKGEPDPNRLEDFKAFLKWYLDVRRLFILHLPSLQENVDEELMALLGWPACWTYVENAFGEPERIPLCFCQQVKEQGFSDDIIFTDTLGVWMAWAMRFLETCPLTQIRQLWRIESEKRVDLAWLPPSAKASDRICKFSGAYWPFVIRDAGDGSWRLVGDCYVHSTPYIEALGGNVGEEAPSAPNVKLCLQRGAPLTFHKPGPRIKTLVEELEIVILS